jgi:hypothetical protein
VRILHAARYVLLSAALAWVSGCDATPAPVAAAPAIATRWHALGTWSGRGDIQTGSFDVTTGALRLRWETRDERALGIGVFRVSLHSAISGRPLQTIVETKGVGANTAYLEDEPRVSYLVVEAQNVEWTATLEELVPSDSPGDASR